MDAAYVLHEMLIICLSLFDLDHYIRDWRKWVTNSGVIIYESKNVYGKNDTSENI